MNDYPPEFDNIGCIERTFGFVEVAWTENDEVYMRKPWAPHPDREDGYEHIGLLTWEDDTPEGYVDALEFNHERLSTFVEAYKDRTRRETGETFVPPDVMERFK